MVKDDWPSIGMTDQYHIYDLNLRFILDMVKDDWSATGMTDQDLT